MNCKCGKEVGRMGDLCNICYARTFKGKPKLELKKVPRPKDFLSAPSPQYFMSGSEERARRVRYSIFRIMGMPNGMAAERSGYPKKFCDDPEFLVKLEDRIRADGVFADVEIPIKELFAAEAGPSLAKLVHLRDNSENEKVQLDCAKTILALAGYTASITKIEPADIAERELSKRSLKDQASFRKTGIISGNEKKAVSEGERVPLRLEEVLQEAQANDGHLLA